MVMSIETYEEMLEAARIDAAIAESEKEFSENGILLDARETLASLREKYFE